MRSITIKIDVGDSADSVRKPIEKYSDEEVSPPQPQPPTTYPNPVSEQVNEFLRGLYGAILRRQLAIRKQVGQGNPELAPQGVPPRPAQAGQQPNPDQGVTYVS